MYISLTDSKDNLMDFNGNIITCSTEDYEEVNTKPKKQEFHRLHIVEETFDLREFCYKEWHLKDVLYVPVENGYGKKMLHLELNIFQMRKFILWQLMQLGNLT